MLLVVDDHLETRQLLTRSFEGKGHAVRALGSCAEALAAVEEADFDVLVLDVMLPDGSGVDLCRTLREQGKTTPILLLTARGDIGDRVRGLDAGADDYLAKPFALAELTARVRALGRRGPLLRISRVQARHVTVDLQARQVFSEGVPALLTARELAIVELLAARQGRIVARDDLIASIWGETSESAGASLDVLMARIRRKLGGPRAPIRTVRGLGYVLDADP